MSPRIPKPDGRARRAQVAAETDLRRRVGGAREERASYLILCEGRTESDYFSGMRTRRGPQLDVDEPGGDHLSIVRAAARRVSDEYDAVWCVLDTELDPELTGAIVEEAKSSDIKVALSTPCFELWLMLHWSHCSSPFQSAESAKRALKEMLPGWREGRTSFRDFADGLDDACSRAKALEPTGTDYLKNPSTAVWKLIEEIRQKP